MMKAPAINTPLSPGSQKFEECSCLLHFFILQNNVLSYRRLGIGNYGSSLIFAYTLYPESLLTLQRSNNPGEAF